MKCPHCGQEHPDELIECPETGKKLKRACKNSGCSYYGEYLYPLDLDTCPCCGRSLIINNNGHEFVDLGLSVKWGTCNVGAKKPEESGDYFAWGETCPKSEYTCVNLKYCNKPTGGNLSQLFRILTDRDRDTFSKYCTDSSYGTNDNRTILELSDDAARANWGGAWRMPTTAEFQELLDKCTWEWTKINGKNGYKVTSKSNGNSIFLPAAGYRSGTGLYYVGSIGYCWSCSLNTYVPDSAQYLSFGSGGRDTGKDYRYCGRSVRPVLPK